ncbi:MAG: sensor domain-containing diguanylate cyclase, partial [Proteobacteria bacterium]|nr:sensor domain-containing diguanylate cyclase [Pseudomonadota bacterium]
VTAKRAAEAALAVSEARFRDLVRLSSDLYWEQDAQFRYTHFDGSPEIMANIPIDQLIGRTRWEIGGLVGVPEARWKEHIETLNRHEPFRDFIYQLGSHSGRVLWYSISGNPMFDADGQFVGYHGTASDITSRLETEARFRHLAYHDSLTGLPNRRLLEDRIGQAIRAARRNEGRLALLLIDLDRFKPINDTFGHAIGDRVLEATGERLRNCVRAADTVARIGGDEFVVLLTAVSTTGDALQVAEKIIARIAEPIDIDGQRHRIGGSVGISLYPAHGDNAEDLLQHADQAMYQGKQQGGRTATIYTPSGTT